MDDIKQGIILQTESYNIQDKLKNATNYLLEEIKNSLETGVFNKDTIQTYYDNLISAKQEEADFIKAFNLVNKYYWRQKNELH